MQQVRYTAKFKSKRLELQCIRIAEKFKSLKFWGVTWWQTEIFKLLRLEQQCARGAEKFKSHRLRDVTCQTGWNI